MALKNCKECGGPFSTSANACPRCGARKGVGVVGCLGGIFLFPIMLYIVLALLGVISGKKNLSKITNPSYREEQVQEERTSASNQNLVLPYSYMITGRRDVSYANTPRMVFEVCLESSELPTEEKMRATAAKIWATDGNRIKNLTIFMIFGEITDFSSGAYGIAECGASGVDSFKINEAAQIFFCKFF
jgi:hypothetical protein